MRSSQPASRLNLAASWEELLISCPELEEISVGSFFYAALLLTEGTGLLLRKRWAEYFTVIITASLMPLEFYELIEKFTLTRVAVIILNAVIVWYLIVQLRRYRAAHHLIGQQFHAGSQAVDGRSGQVTGE